MRVFFYDLGYFLLEDWKKIKWTSHSILCMKSFQWNIFQPLNGAVNNFNILWNPASGWVGGIKFRQASSGWKQLGETKVMLWNCSMKRSQLRETKIGICLCSDVRFGWWSHPVPLSHCCKFSTILPLILEFKAWNCHFIVLCDQYWFYVYVS